MKTRTTVILGIVIAGLVVTSFAFAGEGRGRGEGRGYRHHAENGPVEGRGPGHLDRQGRGKGAFGMRAMQQLNLTEAQKAEIEKISADSKKAAEPLFKEVKILREKVRAEWQKEKPVKGTILDLHKKISAVNDKLAEQHISSRIDMINVLTKAQRAEMLKWQADHGKRNGRGDGHGRREGKGFGKRDGKKFGKSAPQKSAERRFFRDNA